MRLDNSIPRKTVAWIGSGPSPSIRKVLDILGLSVEMHSADSIIPADKPAVGVIIFRVDGMSPTKAYGQAVKIVSKRPLDYGMCVSIASQDLRQAKSIVELLIAASAIPNDALTALDLTEQAIAAYLRENVPGPWARKEIEILPRSLSLDPEDDTLLRRAFRDFPQIKLEPQPGGKSPNCRVWKVITSEDHSLESFIAKTAPKENIVEERNTYDDMVEERIGFPFRAPTIPSRQALGTKRGILVSMFINRAQRLDEYLESSSSPNLVISSLFSEALGSWRTNAIDVLGSLGKFLVDAQRNTDGKGHLEELSNLPNPKRLAEACTICKELWNKLSSLPRRMYRTCKSHGDLNVRNVFVRWHSTDAIIIDFQRAGETGPMAKDLCKLETSIALNVKAKDKHLIPLSKLMALYKHPLLPPTHLKVMADPRLSAIRQIRKHACGDGITNEEYEVVTAAYLLRYAATPIEPTTESDGLVRRRAMAYRIAARIISSL